MDVSDNSEDINLAFAEWQRRLRKAFIPDPHPSDDVWIRAVDLADDGDATALIEVLQTLPRTPLARKLLDDRRKRRQSRGKRGRPATPIYVSRTPMLDWASIYVTMRKRRLQEALAEARTAKKRLDAEKIERLLNTLVSDAASEFHLDEGRLIDHIEKGAKLT
jgi:hypothetical protein